jgi:aspartate/methionine/tyrosine aminotransferase
MKLFSHLPSSTIIDDIPDEVRSEVAAMHCECLDQKPFSPAVDRRFLDIFCRAQNPEDPIELRDLWLGRVEYELGRASNRPWLSEKWCNSVVRRNVNADEVLNSRVTTRFIKELFNWFFRDDLYGTFQSGNNIILSSGSVDEDTWGLPEALKECIRYALDRNWYGYSDSRGRTPALEAIAAYESARITGASYSSCDIAITMGATFAISSIADFIFLSKHPTSHPALCGIPNYPPLVESIARRANTCLVPLTCQNGIMSLEPIIASLTAYTPLVMIQTAANPTGAIVDENELEKLIETASSSTTIILDECHEWLGPIRKFSQKRASSNVIRVSSLSKGWSAPGLKVGWILADKAFISSYYEYASSTFGGPPSFFYTMVEVLMRMERWLIIGKADLTKVECNEFEASYGLDVSRLQRAYDSYRRDRAKREEHLKTLRHATVGRLMNQTSLSFTVPLYSINLALEFPEWEDSYLCFRHLLDQTGVAIYPGILNFCLSGSVARITTARQWNTLSKGLDKFQILFPKR